MHKREILIQRDKISFQIWISTFKTRNERYEYEISTCALCGLFVYATDYDNTSILFYHNQDSRFRHKVGLKMEIIICMIWMENALKIETKLRIFIWFLINTFHMNSIESLQFDKFKLYLLIHSKGQLSLFLIRPD